MVRLYQDFTTDKKGCILSKQLFRSGTGVVPTLLKHKRHKLPQTLMQSEKKQTKTIAG